MLPRSLFPVLLSVLGLLVCTVTLDVIGIDFNNPNCFAAGEEKINRPWNSDVIYFMLTDRFHDGDPTNNVPDGSDPGLFDEDQADISRYHGGDFRGVEEAIKSGYFNDLGVTAIWITPPVENTWLSKFDMESATRPGEPWSREKTGYHGYWAQDFLDIDPHLVSSDNQSANLSDLERREERLKQYRDLVKVAHEHGIKVIQDIVCNHAGVVFYYDKNGSGNFDENEESEWIQPYWLEDNHRDIARWLKDVSKWNLDKTAPTASVTLLGKEVPINGVLGDLNTYGRKGWRHQSFSSNNTKDEEVMCDFLANRDIWTAPGSAFFDKLVDEFVAIYKFYIQEIGVDGLRVDTVKHAHHAFWDEFTERLRERLGQEEAEKAKDLIIFGEVYNFGAGGLGKYTFRNTSPKEGVCFDSVLNFEFCNAVRAYLRHPNEQFGSAEQLENTIKAINNPEFYNTKLGLDGLCARQKLVNFIGNHDGINRFLVKNVGDANHRLALALAMTWEGIPCVYYGSEAGMRDNQSVVLPNVVTPDTETGRLTFWARGVDNRLEEAKQTPVFKTIASLAKYRVPFLVEEKEKKENPDYLPALAQGRMAPLWMHNNADRLRTDSGVFAFCRYLEGDNGDVKTDDSLIVVVNAHPNKTQTTGWQGNPMSLTVGLKKPLLESGDRLVRLPIDGQDDSAAPSDPIEVEWSNGKPSVILSVEPKTINLYRVEKP